MSMSQAALKVGQDIKYFCPKCQLELAHVVLAMIGNEPARIRCNTCKAERNYRPPKRSTSSSSEPRRIAKTPWGHEGFYNEKLKENSLRPTKPYRADAALEVNDLVQHPVFGLGVVLKTTFPDRAEILFKDQARTLICKIAENPMP